MEKERKKAEKKVKKEAISHFKSDMAYYKRESEQDKRNIKAIKKSKSLPKDRLEKHLKGDSKGFRKEIKEDTELREKLKGKKSASSKSNKKAKVSRKKD